MLSYCLISPSVNYATRPKSENLFVIEYPGHTYHEHEFSFFLEWRRNGRLWPQLHFHILTPERIIIKQ